MSSVAGPGGLSILTFLANSNPPHTHLTPQLPLSPASSQEDVLSLRFPCKEAKGRSREQGEHCREHKCPGPLRERLSLWKPRAPKTMGSSGCRGVGKRLVVPLCALRRPVPLPHSWRISTDSNWDRCIRHLSEACRASREAGLEWGWSGQWGQSER